MCPLEALLKMASTSSLEVAMPSSLEWRFPKVANGVCRESRKTGRKWRSFMERICKDVELNASHFFAQQAMQRESGSRLQQSKEKQVFQVGLSKTLESGSLLPLSAMKPAAWQI